MAAQRWNTFDDMDRELSASEDTEIRTVWNAMRTRIRAAFQRANGAEVELLRLINQEAVRVARVVPRGSLPSGERAYDLEFQLTVCWKFQDALHKYDQRSSSDQGDGRAIIECCSQCFAEAVPAPEAPIAEEPSSTAETQEPGESQEPAAWEAAPEACDDIDMGIYMNTVAFNILPHLCNLDVFPQSLVEVAELASIVQSQFRACIGAIAANLVPVYKDMIENGTDRCDEIERLLRDGLEFALTELVDAVATVEPDDDDIEGLRCVLIGLAGENQEHLQLASTIDPASYERVLDILLQSLNSDLDPETREQLLRRDIWEFLRDRTY